MASKVTSKALKGTNYGVIQRGASFTLPVEVKDEYDKPIDLLGHKVEFTIKKVKTDFDRHDDFAYVAKSFLPQMPEQGKFFVMLSSDDLDFEPGKYYFDVELVHEENGMVFRLFTFEFTLDGGPTNRRVNKGMGQWPTGDTITVITLAEGNPVIVVAPTINLDGDIFGQVAVIMDALDSIHDHIEECDQKVATFGEQLGQIGDKLEDLRQEFDVDHIALEELQGSVENIDKEVGELRTDIGDLRETLESQGKTI